MRVLYCLPVFFEYRIPFLKELVRLFNGNFYILYSPLRFKICGKEGLCQRIAEELGKNAIPFTQEHIFDTHSKQWDTMPDIEKGKRIPIMHGLGKAISRVKPDVLITEGYFQWTPRVLLYGLMHGLPVYMGYERTQHTERFCGKFKRMQRKLFNKFFAGFFVNGSETTRYLISLGVPASRIHTAGMSADSHFLREAVNRFKSQADYPHFKAHIRGTQKGLCFLFTGVIDERKGVLPLLKAWRKHQQQHPEDLLLMVGDGAQMNRCRDEAADLPSVVFTGRVPYGDVAKYISLADVSIMPTIEDNWSLVVPEAMSCGLPVATSIYNGCHPELIKEGVNGYVFDTHRVETIVDVLARFHQNDLQAMGQASIELEKPFNTENSARRLFETLCSLHQS